MHRSRKPRRRSTQAHPGLVGLYRRQAKDLTLAGPFWQQITEAGHAHAMWQPSSIAAWTSLGARKAREIVMLILCALQHSRGDGFNGHVGVDDNFVQPTSASDNRGNEKGAVLGADWVDGPRPRRCRRQNLSVSCRRSLAPGHFDLLMT